MSFCARAQPQPSGRVSNSSHGNGQVDWMTLVRPFISISLLRAGPQMLPKSGLLLGLVMLIFAVISAIAYGMRYDLQVVSAAVVVELAMLSTFVAAVLTLYGRSERIVQTLTALVGCGAMIGLVMLPLQVLFIQAELNQQQGAQHVLIVLLFLIWEVLIRGHIFRHALDRGLTFGLMLSITYFWLALEIMKRLLVGLGAVELT